MLPGEAAVSADHSILNNTDFTDTFIQYILFVSSVKMRLTNNKNFNKPGTLNPTQL